MKKLLVVVALAVLPVCAQEDVENAKRVVASIEGLLKDRPNDPTLWYYLARFQAQAGAKAASVTALEKVLAIGNGFLPTQNDFRSVWADQEFQAVRAKLEAKLPRLDSAPTEFELPDRSLIPEGIAYDAPSQSFLLGSVAQRKILRIGPDRAVTEFAGERAGLDAVLGLAVDAPRRTLYAVSTSALTTEGEKKRRNAVVAFDVDSGRVLRRTEVPGATQLNDVAIARGGRVFASDSASGAIYEIPQDGAVREVVPTGVIRGSNGVAVSPDAKRLYVGHSTGIAMVDLASGTVRRTAIPEHETVAGIDGLYEWQGQLIGVQNLTTPGRVILMSLSSDGATITRVQTLLSHHHSALDEPTTGVVTPRGFFLLAATGVSRYNRAGVIENPDTAPKPVVLRIPLPR
ncbi:MAG TPA: SMP-30/gluconolactonase/LRE family protein [Opitutaceae bacterium]|nr:SMP-30/gluconolactonase/LRE family protein [Opitutaceae bacterium]